MAAKAAAVAEDAVSIPLPDTPPHSPDAFQESNADHTDTDIMDRDPANTLVPERGIMAAGRGRYQHGFGARVSFPLLRHTPKGRVQYDRHWKWWSWLLTEVWRGRSL